MVLRYLGHLVVNRSQILAQGLLGIRKSFHQRQANNEGSLGPSNGNGTDHGGHGVVVGIWLAAVKLGRIKRPAGVVAPERESPLA